MNDDVVTSAEGQGAVAPEAQRTEEGRERSIVLLLEALEGRLATPEGRELLRVLASTAAQPNPKRTGNG